MSITPHQVTNTVDVTFPDVTSIVLSGNTITTNGFAFDNKTAPISADLINAGLLASSDMTIHSGLTEAIMNTTKENNGVSGVPKETRSQLFISKKGMLMVRKYRDGQAPTTFGIMPDIVDVRCYKDENGQPRAIRMDFSDNTSTSAACRDNDQFNFEIGVTICLMKRLLDKVADGEGSATYNKLVRRACKVYDLKQKAKEKKRQEDSAKAQKAAKLEAKKQKNAARRAAAIKEEEAAMREDLIEIQKEAYLRAMREYNSPTPKTEERMDGR